MINKNLYPFSAKLAEIVGKQSVYANPCHVLLSPSPEDPVSDIDLAIQYMRTPSLVIDFGKSYFIFAPSLAGRNVQNFDNKTLTVKYTVAKKDTNRTDEQNENRLNAIKAVADNTSSVLFNDDAVDLFNKTYVDEIINECREFRRNTPIWKPYIGADYVIQFTDPLLVQRGATIESVAPAIRELIRPLFAAFEQSKDRVVGIRHQIEYLKLDIAEYDRRIADIRALEAKQTSDAMDIIIINYGSSCTPINAFRNGILEQGAMAGSDQSPFPRWGGNSQTGWWCRLNQGADKFRATVPEQKADAGGQEAIRAIQRDAYRLRLDAFIRERSRLNSILEKAIKVELPKAEEEEIEATKKWDAGQKMVVNFLNRLADAAKKEAEAANQPAIIAAQLEAKRLEEETARQLAELAAKEASEKRKQSLLIAGGAAAVGIVYFVTRGGGGGSRIVNIAVGAALLGGLGYGMYNYFNTPDVIIPATPAPQNLPASFIRLYDRAMLPGETIEQYKLRHGNRAASSPRESMSRVNSIATQVVP